MRVKLCAGDGNRECGAGLECEGEGESIWGGPGTEHFAIDSEALLVVALFGKLS